MNKIIYGLNDIEKTTDWIIGKMEHKILFLNGPIGSGKTTLIKNLCRQFGVKELVNSPTFSILNQYNYNDKKIFHFDFYRINNLKEIIEIGIHDYIDSQSICFIEWGDLIIDRIKTSNHIIDISVLSDTEREITFK
tara:strand:- start:71424 stop:71831 length:408 start_codon:yes stop_codon:yes gene_type:complete